MENKIIDEAFGNLSKIDGKTSIKDAERAYNQCARLTDLPRVVTRLNPARYKGLHTLPLDVFKFTEVDYTDPKQLYTFLYLIGKYVRNFLPCNGTSDFTLYVPKEISEEDKKILTVKYRLLVEPTVSVKELQELSNTLSVFTEDKVIDVGDDEAMLQTGRIVRSIKDGDDIKTIIMFIRVTLLWYIKNKRK